jgi:hypothetical protein
VSLTSADKNPCELDVHAAASRLTRFVVVRLNPLRVPRTSLVEFPGILLAHDLIFEFVAFQVVLRYHRIPSVSHLLAFSLHLLCSKTLVTTWRH